MGKRYRIALNNARFPFVSEWGPRAVVVQSADSASRQPNRWQGSEENIDFNLAQVLYGENFVPVANGLKSTSYEKIVDGIGVTNFDQCFPLRDDQENTVLFSPAGGNNYRLLAGVWDDQPCSGVVDNAGYVLATDPTNKRVTRAYVDGKTFVCYANLVTSAAPQKDCSIFYWKPDTKNLVSVLHPSILGIIVNLPIPVGEIEGVSSSNGYLIVWSGLAVYWAPFNGTAFDFQVYSNGEVTGAGSQIPEDIKGPITAITPVSRGFIIWTTKNAIAAIYNANNFASPWIFAEVKNCGGVDSFEQVTETGGNDGDIYAYTTSGMQKITLNSAESVFPDATDFLGARYIERFNDSTLEMEAGAMSLEMFVKVTMCGNRFLVISYGTYPGIYGFALVYDATLERWGKLRIIHRDCFAYSYGSLPAEITYSMLGDVEYDMLESTAYEDLTIAGGNLTYPRQSIAFMLESGEIQLAVMDEREQEGEQLYPSFVLLGKNQFTRSKFSTLHSVELEGSAASAEVHALVSLNGATFSSSSPGVLREATGNYTEWGFDLPTGKTITLLVKGKFHLSTVVLEVENDGSI